MLTVPLKEHDPVVTAYGLGTVLQVPKGRGDIQVHLANGRYLWTSLRTVHPFYDGIPSGKETHAMLTLSRLGWDYTPSMALIATLTHSTPKDVETLMLERLYGRKSY